MILYGEECYARFNLLIRSHFKNSKWMVNIENETSVVRVWQLINEYAGVKTKMKSAL